MAYTATKSLEYVTRKLQGAVEMADEAKNKFAADILDNPMYALGWGQGPSATMAKGEVAKRLLNLAKAGEGTEYTDEYKFAAMLELAQDEALRAARSPSRSTNPYRNIVEQDLGAAWADFAHELLSFSRAMARND